MFASLLAMLLVAAPATPTTSAEDEARTAEASDDREETVCRRRPVPAERVGERFRIVRVCKTREEWEESRQRRAS